MGLFHEGHQRHESDPRNPGPSRGPRPGGPAESSPARKRWVPSPHDNQPRRGDRSPSFPTANIRSRLHRPTTRRNTKRISRKGVRRRRSEIPLLPPVEIRPVFIHEQRRSPNDRHTKQAFFASTRLRVSHLCCGMKSHANNEEPGSSDVFACPLQPETHFHTETPRPIAPRMKRGSPRRSRRLGVKQLHGSYPSSRLGVRIFGMQTILTPRHGARRAKRITAPCLTRRACREIAFSFETRWGPQPRCG